MKKYLPLLLLAFWLPAHAAPGDRFIRYTFEGYFDDVSPELTQSAEMGDPFTLTFDMDLDSVATHSFYSAQYPLTNLTFSLGTGALGNYPGGYMTGSALLSLVSFGDSNTISLQLYEHSISGELVFPTAEGLVFQSLQLSLKGDIYESFVLQGNQDVALRDTFTTLSLADFTKQTYIGLQFSEDYWMHGYISSISVAGISDGSPIPEPSTYATLAGIAALGVTLVIRKRNKKAS
jgi:hypothetical protein